MEVTEDGHRQELPQEEQQQPAPALLEHVEERGAHVGVFQGLHTGQLLDVLRGLLLRDVGHVVRGDDPHQDALAVDDRQGEAVVPAHLADRLLAIVERGQRLEAAVHHRFDRVLELGQEHLADANVVDEPPR